MSFTVIFAILLMFSLDFSRKSSYNPSNYILWKELFFSTTIYEKCCKERYSLNRMTEETVHEERPLFGTENKIFQDLRYYKLLDVDFQQR